MSENVYSPAEPDRQVSGFIILVSLLQGLSLYLLFTGADAGWTFFDQLSGRVYGYSLVLGLPTLMTLSVRSLRDPRFWQHAGLALLAWLALASWAAWTATDQHGITAETILGPFVLSCFIAEFIALPFLQCRLDSGRWRPAYPDLARNAWNNVVIIAVACAFTGLSWVIIALAAALFDVVGINAFEPLILNPLWINLISSGLAGLGIVLGRSLHRQVELSRQSMARFCRWLLPATSAIAVLFLCTLPFKGMSPLWETGHASILLTTLICSIVLLINAVYQDGTQAVDYPKALRWLVSAGLLCLPLYAAISVYSLWMRIEQHGWTGRRILLFAGLVLIAAHALGVMPGWPQDHAGHGWASSRPSMSVWRC